MKKYATRDRLTGTIIDDFTSIEAAQKAIERYEQEDRDAESYEPNYYEIAVYEDDETATTWQGRANKRTTKERLQDIRVKLGAISQRDLAAYAGVPLRTLTSWLNGSRECPGYVIELIERIAEADVKALEEDRPTSVMERWAVIDQEGMDEWVTVCGSKADALQEASRQWKQWQDHKNISVFMVGLIHCQIIDPKPYTSRFSWALMEDGISVDGDIYEIAKDYLAGE